MTDPTPTTAFLLILLLVCINHPADVTDASATGGKTVTVFFGLLMQGRFYDVGQWADMRSSWHILLSFRQ